MKIKTYLPTEEVNVVDKVKSFKQQVETANTNYNKQDERIEAGEAMWLMEATANYLYNRNAKYQKDRENLTLDLELSFELEQDEKMQATLSKNKVLQEVKTLHAIIESRSSSMNRLPRLVDYEIASIKDGVINYKVEVILVTEELRESYDENRKYGLPKISKIPTSTTNGVINISNYDCVYHAIGAVQADNYAAAVVDCLEDNYGQYFATFVGGSSSHSPNSSISNYSGTSSISCYDDGSYDEYAMKGEIGAHDYYYPSYFEQYSEEAIDLWNGDIATFTPGVLPGPFVPHNVNYGPQTFTYAFLEIGSKPYWCIRGVRMGRSYLYSHD